MSEIIHVLLLSFYFLALHVSAQVFDPQASSNLAVYFGHSTGNSNANISNICADSSVNIVIIGFVRAFNGGSNAPTLDFGGFCKPSSTSVFCSEFANQLAQCQSAGKKLFVSIGGSTSSTSFSSQQDASNAAAVMWRTFGGDLTDMAIRPFGQVVIDGYDLDVETGSTQYQDVFAATLRAYFPLPREQYFISAAPLCANTSEVMPYAFYQQTDFVWARFYNARACALGTKGFGGSYLNWYNYIGNMQTVTVPYPKLYLGGLSFNNSNSGYLQASQMVKAIAQVRSENCPSVLGGTMLWDGTYGLATSDFNGLSYNQAVGYAMQSSPMMIGC